jgi:hypothetical protein
MMVLVGPKAIPKTRNGKKIKPLAEGARKFPERQKKFR